MILYDLTTMTPKQVDQVASNFARWEGVHVWAEAQFRFACHRAMARLAELHDDIRLADGIFHSPRCRVKYWHSALFTAHNNLYRLSIESFCSGLPPDNG